MGGENLDQRNVQLNLDAIIRGRIISQFNFIDVVVGTIISYHYVSDPGKRSQFYEDMIMDMPFGRKSTICKALIKKHYKIFYDKRLWNRIDKIAEFRNIITHQIAAVSDEFLDKKYNDQVMLCRFVEDPMPPTIITLKQKDEYTMETCEIMSELIKTARILFPDAGFLSPSA